MKSLIEKEIAAGRAKIDSIRSNPETPSFDNTIVALETADEDLSIITSRFFNLLSADGTPEMHEDVQEIGPMLSAYSNDILLDEKIFDRVKQVWNNRDQENLTEEDAKLLEESYKSFARNGALLPDDKKERLREISSELSTLSPQFSKNVLDATKEWTLLIEDQDDLSGLPQNAIDAAAHEAEELDQKGNWVFTLDIPSYLPFIKFSDKRNLREMIWRAFGSRSWNDEFDNSDLLKRIVALRLERAKLLGYTTHAHYVLEKRMAKSPETVFDFLNKCAAIYKPAALKDLAELKEFSKKYDGTTEIKPWDIAYYSEKLKQEKFGFSMEEFRPYFQTDKVIAGVFDHADKLFGLRFEDDADFDVYHKDVTAYKVYDQESDQFLGNLLIDLYPRSTKKGGAWQTTYKTQGLFHGKIERPVVSIVGNLTRPVGDKPALLSFEDVETIFHEFGHAMHSLLSQCKYQSLAGTSVRWDFVELPSQVMENWLHENEVLDSFAVHYETGEKIPDDLIQKLDASSKYMSGWTGLRQTSLAMTDMGWHSLETLDDIADVAAFEDELTKDLALFPRLAGPVSTTFSHIFAGGYSAGYYSYKWAEVLDADAFEAFKEHGLYDQDTAKKFRKEVLERGGVVEPDILYRNFRGRDADPDALRRREGL